MKFRRFHQADASAVRALHVRALAGTGADLGDGVWDRDLDQIGQVYLDSGGEFLVGLLDGELVAMGALRPLTATEAAIKRMRVAPERQRLGLGRRMLDALERRASELGFERLELDVTTVQTAAQGLYASCGFTEFRREAGPQGLTVLYMEKTLGLS